MRFVSTLFLVLTICFVVSSDTKAASFYGKVVEVSDGDTIRIFNLNRSVSVKLLGVDAPETKQRFGDVARQHLHDLIFDKFVTVEYSGIGSGSILGRISLNKTDVCAQMIRDGAAWFDSRHGNMFDDTAEVYRQSEQAARSERRGLWQDDAPIAPWEFVKAELELRKPRPEAGATVAPVVTPRTNTTGAALTNESVRWAGIPARLTPAPKANGEGALRWSEGTADGNWKTMRPVDQPLSVFVPTDGQYSVAKQQWGDQTVDSHSYAVRDEVTSYHLFWVAGPTHGEADSVVVDQFFNGMLEGFGRAFENDGGGSFSCKPRKSTPISMNSYFGREFDLSGCTVPGVARVFTTLDLEAGLRHIYVAMAVYRPGGAGNALTFVKSVKLGTTATKTPSAKTATPFKTN